MASDKSRCSPAQTMESSSRINDVAFRDDGHYMAAVTENHTNSIAELHTSTSGAKAKQLHHERSVSGRLRQRSDGNVSDTCSTRRDTHATETLKTV